MMWIGDSSPTGEGMARETRALPGRWQLSEGGRWRRVQAGRPAGLVGMVSHRPLPGLPDEVGIARETRALPGRWQLSEGEDGSESAGLGFLPWWLGVF